MYFSENSGADKWIVHRSINGGATWTTVFNLDTFNGISYNGTFPFHAHSVEVDPYTGNVWLGVGDMYTRGIFMSPNNGDTWTNICADRQPTVFAFTEDKVIMEADIVGNAQIDAINKTDNTFDRATYPKIFPTEYSVTWGNDLRFQSSGNLYLTQQKDSLLAKFAAGLWVSPDKGVNWYLLMSRGLGCIVSDSCGQ